MPNPVLPAGYSQVKPGQIANVVTCLEMTAPPPPSAPQPGDADFVLADWLGASLAAYRDLFREIGTDWLWYSRLVMPDAKLAAILEDPRVDLYRLMDRAGRVLGLLELDFRAEGQCELAFFGLIKAAIGKGAGRFLVTEAIRLAWAREVDGQHIRRFWVHTCTFDHPNALGFYRKAGFEPYAFMVEVADDPRLSGHLPRNAAPHVPLIEPK
jgi:GNAT superfamily N-acetyltransferase